MTLNSSLFISMIIINLYSCFHQICLVLAACHCEASGYIGSGIYGIDGAGLYNNYQGAYASSYTNYVSILSSLYINQRVIIISNRYSEERGTDFYLDLGQWLIKREAEMI